MVRKSKALTAMVFITFLLVTFGCSSSNNDQNAGGVNPETPENTLTGAFIDSPVSGLSYITSSGLQGITNAAGQFSYLLGDAVTFSVGAITLGTIKGAEKITPFDLVGYDLKGGDLEFSDFLLDIGEAEIKDTPTKFEHGVNMLIFLQSLDVNNDAGDGIEISDGVFQFFTLATAALILNSETPAFVDAFVLLFVQLVTDGILSRNDGDLPIDRDDALRHFVLNN